MYKCRLMHSQVARFPVCGGCPPRMGTGALIDSSVVRRSAQVSVQRTLQQTPSTQRPDSHAASAVHASPSPPAKVRGRTEARAAPDVGSGLA